MTNDSIVIATFTITKIRNAGDVHPQYVPGALRFTRRWGPHRIAYHLHLARATVGRVLARYGMPKLANIDQATGLPVRRPKPKRYEVAAPGQLVHVDIKKLGRIPDGGGWVELNAARDAITVQPIPSGQEVLIVIGEGLDKAAIEAAVRGC